ncbi:hypothetical protein SCHPADRAFT_941136 [Schizopora paradoxa]|uniref:Uncharacterized protein n=1 Tax=Schizopora paradoxa TaxID=27342 RepID=A0A0H2RLV5_9AGAM|nr:hypothetical protein SCHPADRAFT_941136 [Schizopora paradoxa]
MPPTATTTVTATVAIITEEPISSSDGPATGHVVLIILGGLALAFIFVVVTVPILRWRLYGKRRAPSDTQSRASSRRTHIRIPSGKENGQPLLDGQGKHLSVTGQWQGAERKGEASGSKGKQAEGGEIFDEKARMSTLSPDTPVRPPSAVFNWKILSTLPNFSDESLSSLGEPLEAGANNLSPPQASTSTSNVPPPPPPPPPKQDIPTLEIITATNTTASTSRQSTLVGERSNVALVSSPLPLSPDSTVSPLTHAFAGPLSSASSINTVTQSMFRYPSLSTSLASHGASSSASAANHGSNSSHGQLQAAVLPISSGAAGPDTIPVGKNVVDSWWHMAPPMPSIPESSRSPSTPSSDAPDNRTSSGTARLRELFVAVPPPEPGTSSGHLQVASYSTEASSDGRAPRLSMSGSIIVPAPDNSITRQSSAKTHYTFGRPNSLVLTTPMTDSFIPFTAPPALPALPVPPSGMIIPDQNSVPFPASASPGQDQSFETQQRSRQHSNVQLYSRFSTPTISSNGGDADDVSRKRQSYDYPREPSPPLVPTPLAHPPSRPSPILKPQSEIEENASPAPLPTPKLLLRPVSPLGFDDALFSVSRTQTPLPAGGFDASTSQQGSSGAAAATPPMPPVPILPPPPAGKKRRLRRKSTSSSSYSEHSRTASSGTSGSNGSRGSLKARSGSQRMSRRVTFGIPPDTATRATFASASESSTSTNNAPPQIPEPPLPVVEPLRLSSPRRSTFSNANSRMGASESWSAPTSPTGPVTMTGRDTSVSPTSPISPVSGVRRAIRPLPIPPLSPGTSPPLASPPFASRNEEEQPLINAPPDYDA